jgi:hypothetical protein
MLGVPLLLALQHRPQRVDLSASQKRCAMSSQKVVTVAALVTVLMWSTVMAVLGQVAAAAALLPSLGLLLQQIVQALSSPDGPHLAGGRSPAAGEVEKGQVG